MKKIIGIVIVFMCMFTFSCGTESFDETLYKYRVSSPEVPNDFYLIGESYTDRGLEQCFIRVTREDWRRGNPYFRPMMVWSDTHKMNIYALARWNAYGVIVSNPKA